MTILDVRSPDEFSQGHVDGAINFDVQLLMRGALPNIPKNEEIVAYCRSGSRSEIAVQILKQHGYLHARNGGGLSDMAG